MINQLYLFFAIGAFWTSFVLSLLFLFIPVPHIPQLENYKTAKRIMAFAYMLFCVISLHAISILSEEMNLFTFRISILIFATFQLLIFAYVNISLIELRFLSIKKLIYHSIPVAILSLLNLGSYRGLWGDNFSNILYYSFLIFYIFSVGATIVLFIKHHRNYKKRFENYFTGNSRDHLQWVSIASIFISLTGIAVILFCIFMREVNILFPILGIAFYIYYAIHFINYTEVFNYVEPIVGEEVEKNGKASSITFSQIENSIREWERSKLYLKPDLTISIVASQISTNRTYLSNYLNTIKEVTFNEWINALRLEEAKKIILVDKYVTLDDLCEKTGYSDTSYFSKCFKKYTGTTVSQWKSSLE
ncbi:MAG: helix-turn-helix domain-containing protein [Proteiniphilum sp.]